MSHKQLMADVARMEVLSEEMSGITEIGHGCVRLAVAVAACHKGLSVGGVDADGMMPVVPPDSPQRQRERDVPQMVYGDAEGSRSCLSFSGTDR